MGKSGRTDRLGIVGDVSTPIFPSSALIANLTVSESLTINTLPYPSSTVGVKSVLTSFDNEGDTNMASVTDNKPTTTASTITTSTSSSKTTAPTRKASIPRPMTARR